MPAALDAQHDVRQHVDAPDQLKVLKCPNKTEPSAPMGGQPRDVVSADRDRTIIGSVEARHNVDESGFDQVLQSLSIPQLIKFIHDSS
jgi:hypothetical protein